MCVLKSLGITQGFVAAQKESKDVTDKDLLTMGGVSELFDQLKWVLDIDFGYTRAKNSAGGIYRFTEFFEPEPAVMVIELKEEAKEIHL